MTLFAATCVSAQKAPTTWEEGGQRGEERRNALNERMRRYGISREDVKEIGGRMMVAVPFEKNTPDHTYDKIHADDVLKPGEHYRFEIDEYVITMLIPDAPPGSSSIVPFADTRSNPGRDAILRKSPTGLQLANLSWHYGTGVWPLYVGWKGGMAVTLNYRAVSPETKTTETHASPESLRDTAQRFIESLVPPPGEAEAALKRGFIDNRLGTRIHLNAEPVVINGRIWVRTAMNERYGRRYTYRTVLRPDRWLLAGFSVPQFDYNANPDPSTYPAALKRAFADMEAMLASLRVSTLNDDGAPDPFVIERVEPAPLPVREKRPATQ
jgi:hypothetical protein